MWGEGREGIGRCAYQSDHIPIRAVYLIRIFGKIRSICSAEETRRIGYKYSVLFAVGLPMSQETQRKLLLENELYGDILQAEYNDVYQNLTLKRRSQSTGTVKRIRMLEDVFITGILSEAANITVTHLGDNRITSAKRYPRIHKK
ncbi:hypothetical protein OSTOST_05291, partial [Ostertagia ostertagi]